MGFPIPAEKIEYRHYIDGAFAESSDGGKFELKSPYNHQKITDICEASVEDTNRAVAAAKAAFPAWSAKSPAERGALLKALAAKVRAAGTELAQLNAMDMGRPVASYFDAHFASTLFEHYAESGYEAKGTTSLNTPGFINMTFRQPIGPVAAIIPWNVPVISFAMKVGPAVATGCTIVLKSSEKAPLTAARIAQFVHEVGFPPGVINVLSGHGTPSGATLASHMDIRMVNFTGSTFTGRKIQAMAASSNLKKVVLELGGKSPAIIFPDADITKAVAETSASIMMIMGQACIANSRIYVHESVAEQFKKAFVIMWKNYKKGDPLLPETQQGPQADEIQRERGNFIEPTIFEDVDENDKTQKEEVFGPFVNINTFKTEAEVLEKANATEYGLYASVYTKDISRAMRFAKGFESGTVGINCTSPAMAFDMPFGGYKGSGQGREGFGNSTEEHLEIKTVLIKLDENSEGMI
ncbi:uncharacterized protein MYCFIDRAFT_77659 [Pseudocercospora fijiensis CIRAD86]|uniref:aldehyde dehydrogenase (NAD(+)) n=1 Tax=Pseudocercospora fijiensis (strain CIRAD86) TaxID=383855 RepID=M3ABT1_PSEFD|nr:uncharacterized protein MYCFIDRAFT_77659 [Pseudocercospora fijiensis CIRAD86]EME82031.1 hypothetical protein MYCFIDRAFT_77659 [Pseudocercospora fijiensis CIRAD86]